MSELKDEVNSNVDFYGILGLELGADDAAIKRAYRQASMRYHPDKVGADDVAAAEMLQLVQRAKSLLLDESLRPLYDNARKVREQQKAQQAAMSDKRREMVERLENAERAGVKRKRDEDDEQRKVAARKAEISETYRQRRAEFEAARRADEVEASVKPKPADVEVARSDLDRAVTLRFLQNDRTKHLTEDYLIKVFSQFGQVDTAALMAKRLRAPGEKHRQDYMVATIVFKSIIATLKAVTEFDELRRTNDELRPIESITRYKQKEKAASPRPDAAVSEQTAATDEPNKGVPKFSFSTKTKSIVT